MKAKRKMVTLRLPIDIKAWLDSEVALNGSSQSSETARILRAEVLRRERQREQGKAVRQ
jgi:hypothetical protein